MIASRRPSVTSSSTSHSHCRKGLKQTKLWNFLMTQENTFLQIVYSQIVFFFCLWRKEKKMRLFWFVWISPFTPPPPPPSSSPLWYFLYSRRIPCFLVFEKKKEFWKVLLDLYCLVKCSYKHSPTWSALLSLLPIYFFFFVLSKARFFGGHPVLCKSNSRNSLVSRQ